MECKHFPELFLKYFLYSQVQRTFIKRIPIKMMIAANLELLYLAYTDM